MLLTSLFNASFFFFFNDTATTEIYTLSLYDALPISIAPQRPAGVRWRTRSCRPVISCRARRVSAVSIQPGSTALTWMLSCAHAEAHALVNCTIPPLEAAYAGAKPAPKIDIIEPMLMILPRPVAFIAGYAACEQR